MYKLLYFAPPHLCVLIIFQINTAKEKRPINFCCLNLYTAWRFHIDLDEYPLRRNIGPASPINYVHIYFSWRLNQIKWKSSPNMFFCAEFHRGSITLADINSNNWMWSVGDDGPMFFPIGYNVGEELFLLLVRYTIKFPWRITKHVKINITDLFLQQRSTKGTNEIGFLGK